ncbi:hypothetical protein DZC78_11270 [Olleya aquimaris]|jgi:hypothetical protein|uniref:Uncharacterized protein n=1 Tax=Olleya sediminilitoris TaxID=2795739 RepID=A0ABS1WNG5_9FLAO|nr:MULTISPECIES: hypothetical protein [Olleya]AXO80940.1 hypothetical protein DZC78_11270 [Olleya aquimaris]MBL7560657.1 hypothetical protein [Olleya sediminilitoris]
MNLVQTKPTKKGKLYCSIFGHNFQVSKQITYHVNEYQCSHCKKEMTTDSTGQLTAMTPKYKEINSVLERIHQNKLVRYAKQQNTKVLKMTS